MTANDVADWFSGAKGGDTFVYYKGFNLDHSVVLGLEVKDTNWRDVRAYVWRLYVEGRLELTQQRISRADGFNYIATKRRTVVPVTHAGGVKGKTSEFFERRVA